MIFLYLSAYSRKQEKKKIIKKQKVSWMGNANKEKIEMKKTRQKGENNNKI